MNMMIFKMFTQTMISPKNNLYNFTKTGHTNHPISYEEETVCPKIFLNTFLLGF